MRRVSLPRASLVALLAIVLLASAPLASASIRWCKTDPIVEIDGREVNIFVFGERALKERATGPTEVTVTVPPHVQADLVSTDDGFNGHGERVTFETSKWLHVTPDGVQIQVAVRVPADDQYAVRVKVADRRGDNLLDRDDDPTDETNRPITVDAVV